MKTKINTYTCKHKEVLDIKSLNNLNSLNPGDKCTVFRIPEIAILPSLGIRIGKTLEIITRSIASGPIIICTNNRTVAIGKNIASEILVKRLATC